MHISLGNKTFLLWVEFWDSHRSALPVSCQASPCSGVVVQLYQLPEIIKGILRIYFLALIQLHPRDAEARQRALLAARVHEVFFFLPSLWRHELLLIQLMCFTPACNEFSPPQKIMTRSRTHKLCSLFLRESVSTCVCVCPYVCARVCTYASNYAYVRVCLCVCVFVRGFVYVWPLSVCVIYNHKITNTEHTHIHTRGLTTNFGTLMPTAWAAQWLPEMLFSWHLVLRVLETFRKFSFTHARKYIYTHRIKRMIAQEANKHEQ